MKEVCVLMRNTMRPTCRLQRSVQLIVHQPIPRNFLKSVACSGWINIGFTADGWRGRGAFRNVSQLLCPVKSLAIFCGKDDNPDQEVTKQMRHSRNYALKAFISKSPKLENLTLDLGLLLRNLKPVLKNIRVRNRLDQLEGLYLFPSKLPAPVFQSKLEDIYDNLNWLLASTSAKLKRFGFESLEFNENETFGTNNENIYDLVARLILKYRNGLQELTLKGDICKLNQLTEIVFPVLKSLHVATTVGFSPARNVIQFLRAQPLLEHLNLEYEFGAPYALINAISEKSLHLKTLSLSIPKYYETGLEGHLVPHNMRFLKSISGLEALSIFQHKISEVLPAWLASELMADGIRESRLNVTDILPFLPSSIKRLTITNVMFEMDLFPGEGDVDGDEWDATWYSKFGRFAHLTHLSLLGCLNGLDDLRLQSLTAKGQLIELEFSHCDRVTDAGILGLINLKALRKLAIVACPTITNVGLTAALHFQELQSLTLWPPAKESIPDDVLVMIASSNPSLEYLSTRTESGTSADLDIKISKVCPRFKRTNSEEPWFTKENDEFDVFYGGSISGGEEFDFDDFDFDDGEGGFDDFDSDSDSD